MSKLFGTDGIRGIVNQTLTGELAYKVGVATSTILKNDSKFLNVIIGTDTRRSNDMLKSAVICGLCSNCANVIDVGILPTPAIAYLVTSYQVDAGIMITASHNPSEYNGIKIFGPDGFKLPDEVEEKIETIIENFDEVVLPANEHIGTVKNYNTISLDYYAKHLISSVENIIPMTPLTHLSIAVDCSNGAATEVAERIFNTDILKNCVETCMLGISPDGFNINKDCGSTSLDSLKNFVLQNNFDIGIAFDGDADRCLFIDDKGDVVDGDFILAIVADYLKKNNNLSNNTVVGTIMSNLGFITYCNESGIKFEATKVGDRFVLEEMLLNNYSIGGEQSGHIIFRDYATTGDGLLTALQILKIMFVTGKSLHELKLVMQKYPQVLKVVKADANQKLCFLTNKSIKNTIRHYEYVLGKTGRIVIRPSGTENFIRVMVEGTDEQLIEEIAEKLCNFIKEIL